MPYPVHGGFQLRLFNLLMRIKQHHDVAIACHVWTEQDVEGAAWLSNHGIRTITAPLAAMTWRHVLPSIIGYFLRGQPPEVAQFQSQELRQAIESEQVDILQIEESILAPYYNLKPTAKKIITFHNIHYVQEQRIADISPRLGERAWRQLNAWAMRRFEPRICRKFDRRIVVSPEDRMALEDAGNTLPVDILPNGVDTDLLRPLPMPAVRRSLIFVGTLIYRPCADGAIWMIKEVMPRLRARFPDLEFWVVGRSPPAELIALSGDGIYVTGTVPNVEPYYARAAIACVPLRAGGGSRLKILEAMALGRPVVSTTVGAEGLDVTHGEDILIADDAHAFAESIAGLLESEARSMAMSANARRLVQQRYDWADIASRQLEIYEELARC